MGNTTREVELRYSPKGSAIAKLGLAINREWKTESGEKKEEVCFVDVDVFGRQAEVISQYVKKGNPILVEGRLRLNTWEDKNTHQKISKLTVVLESFSFVGNKSDSSTSQPSGYSSSRSTAPASTPPPAEPDMPPAEPDDVPF